MKFARVALIITVLTGCAHADYAQLADSATTAVALTQEGFAEGNPLLSHMGWPGIAATKLAVTQVVKLTPTIVCEPGLMGLTVVGYNAALWNVAVIAGSGPAALPLMVLLTGWGWDRWLENSKVTCLKPFTYIEDFNEKVVLSFK